MQGEPKKDYLKELKKRTIWRRIVACLAVVVAVSTGYALILPAVTMEQQAVSESKKETEADWEATLPDALTGEWGTDLAAVAQSQIGYTESSTDTVVNDAGETCGYTRYGAWYGDEYGDWNGMFLAFCLHYAEIPEDAVKASADVSEILKEVQEKGFYKEAGQYEPEVGDIAFLPDAQAGVVTASAEEGVSVLAGDVSGTAAVIEKAEPLGYGSIEIAEKLYIENGAESQTESGEGEGSAGETGEQADDNGSQPAAEEKVDGVQNQQNGSSEHSQAQMPENDVSVTEDAETEQRENLCTYVMGRGFDNEKASFIVKLLDANGQEVEPDESDRYPIYEGEPYTYSFSLYAPKGIPEAGEYEYKLPEGITAADFSAEDITADDGTVIGHLSVADDGTTVLVSMVDNTKVRLRIYFQVYLSFTVDEQGVPVNKDIYFVTEETETIDKSWGISEKGQLEWTIVARIPGYNGGDYHSWYFMDSSSVRTPDLSKASVSITHGNQTETVPIVGTAEAEDSEIACYWDETEVRNPKLWLVSKRTSHENCTGGSTAGLPDQWCTDWCLEESSVVTIQYVDDKWDIEKPDSMLRNTVDLYKDSSWAAGAEDSVKGYEMIKKEEAADGQFTITLNPEKTDLSSESRGVIIRDQMTENLYYQRGTISIVTEDDDGVQQTLSYGTDYSVVVSDDLHHLEINILYPGKYMYTITYNVLIKAEAESEENYVNTAEVDVLGHRFETSKNGSMAYSSAEEYVVSMQKTEKETGEYVSGAEYGLYSSSGELLDSKITDENGRITFEGNPAEGVMLLSGHLYYLQEITAPEHYELSDIRYWFYYDNSTEAEIESMLTIAEGVGMYRPDKDKLEIVSNHGFTDKVIEGSLQPAELIQVQDELIRYELPETGSTGTRMYTIAGLLLTGSAVTALYREKCKKRRNKK